MLINFLPLVHLVRSVPRRLLIASISGFVDEFSRCRMDRQMAHIRSLREHPTAMA